MVILRINFMKKYIFGAIIIQLIVISVIYFITKLVSVDLVVTEDKLTAVAKKVEIIPNTPKTTVSPEKSSKNVNKTLNSPTDNSVGLASSEGSDGIKIEEFSANNLNNKAQQTKQPALAQNNTKPKLSAKNNAHKINGNKIVTIINNDGSSQEIKLLDVEIDDQLKQDLADRAKNIMQNKTDQNNEVLNGILLKSVTANGTLDIAHDLGMANVPVLNQGSHGTCVTFATTAILNAKMNAGDFISQQCFLELGVYISNTSKSSGASAYSGWNGLFSTIALERFKQYGVVGKNSCPHDYANTSYSLSYQMYLDLSSSLWTDSFDYKKLKKGDLDAVKMAINNHNRIAVGILLHKDFVAGTAINGKSTGLWNIPYDVNQFLTELTKGGKLAGGHALVLTGYDDEKQLLKVRNSWGSKIGDSGEYYISYDYYKLMAMEAIEVF